MKTAILNNNTQKIICLNTHKQFPRQEFLHDINALQQQMPNHQYVINLCEDRYQFMLGFAAALRKKQVTLLPQNNKPHSIKQLLQEYQDCYCLTDKPLNFTAPTFSYIKKLMNNSANSINPIIPQEQIATIIFTSGSTGQPKPSIKTWGNLITTVQKTIENLKLTADSQATLLSTVPAQHMFGLEHSIIMPWQLGYAISNFNPFFPEDIHQQTRQLSQKIILLTTPIHIQACINSGIRFENILQVISSTMPLSQEMASAGEDCFNAPITEIYGSTETGAMGFRRTSTEPMWHLYKGLTISEKNHQFLLHKPDGKHIEIHDQLQLYQNNQFSIIGRNSDLIKIAGKRMSLADLNFKLNSLDGVEEGIFVLPSNSEVNSTTRLKVFVVAPTLSEQQILTLLKPLIDPLFLPRTIVKIDSLPKNTLGKILLSELTERK